MYEHSVTRTVCPLGAYQARRVCGATALPLVAMLFCLVNSCSEHLEMNRHPWSNSSCYRLWWQKLRRAGRVCHGLDGHQLRRRRRPAGAVAAENRHPRHESHPSSSDYTGPTSMNARALILHAPSHPLRLHLTQSHGPELHSTYKWAPRQRRRRGPGRRGARARVSCTTPAAPRCDTRKRAATPRYSSKAATLLALTYTHIQTPSRTPQTGIVRQQRGAACRDLLIHYIHARHHMHRLHARVR